MHSRTHTCTHVSILTHPLTHHPKHTHTPPPSPTHYPKHTHTHTLPHPLPHPLTTPNTHYIDSRQVLGDGGRDPSVSLCHVVKLCEKSSSLPPSGHPSPNRPTLTWSLLHRDFLHVLLLIGWACCYYFIMKYPKHISDQKPY